jgi:hypothetical protein
MVGFPPKYCRPIATLVNGDDAYVLLNSVYQNPRRRTLLVSAARAIRPAADRIRSQSALLDTFRNCVNISEFSDEHQGRGCSR